MPNTLPLLTSLLVALLTIYGLRRQLRALKASRRRKSIPIAEERVLVIGASSGVGREIALQYAKRGARVAIVGRKADNLERVLEECVLAAPRTGSTEGGDVYEEQAQSASDAGSRKFWGFTPIGSSKYQVRFFSVAADFSVPSDAARVGRAVQEKWGGIDTLVITAGVSSVRMFMDSVSSTSHPTTGGLEAESAYLASLYRAKSIAQRALDGNMIAPLISIAAFIPLLRSSASPSVLLLSSVAALIPAPSRALYAATKSASLLFFQALAIEHPRIHFSFVLPGTIEGSFRAGAIDLPSDPIIGATDAEPPASSSSPLSKKLTRLAVASRCVEAIDHSDRTVWMPGWYQYAHALYWTFPWVVERGAKKKYHIQ